MQGSGFGGEGSRFTLRTSAAILYVDCSRSTKGEGPFEFWRLGFEGYVLWGGGLRV